ncbi:MOSC domain-containing protein [Pasteurella canis]|uniref:MOSC domain-containing protein n=1 Tax=Pasteurella canis TaxID=753 RepID=UPI001CBE4952|nr:MOSC N-terminal beta barrel domain-containing protein [Pasteurella canis]UAX42920.1 MOSC domain-containing protein [Pasteurella canis]UAY78432.1 MOSC domain-containing protein [Pasteurella canis]
MQVTQLYLYPIKSTQAYQVSQAVVQPLGLNFDREFMLTEMDGKFLSARKDPELYHLFTFPIPMGLQIQHKDGDMLTVYYRHFQQQSESEVWGNHFLSWVAEAHINQWFSEKIGRQVQLRWIGEQSQRYTKRQPDAPVSFADGYPILLTTQASLTEVQTQCPSQIKMLQFRPNIVIDGEHPFIEQEWKQLKIGNVVFLNVKSCTRCILTARDPDKNTVDAKMEPFRTLKKINTNVDGQPLFGINLIPLNTGIIRLHDKIEIIE